MITILLVFFGITYKGNRNTVLIITWICKNALVKLTINFYYRKSKGTIKKYLLVMEYAYSSYILEENKILLGKININLHIN